MTIHRLCTITLMLTAVASSARGDEILLGRIPISGVEVRGVTECEVHYTMAGRLSTRPIDRVILHLDAMPALQKAETAAAEGRLDEAMNHFDEAYAQASEPWHKTWVHYRRTRLLDAAGRYTPACQAWATLLLTSVDACWLDAMPASRPDRPDAATRDAALVQLRKALEQAQPDSVAAEMLDETVRIISNLETSERYQTGEAPEEVQAPAEPDAAQPIERPAPPAGSGDVADEIDGLIEAGRTREARRQIEQWVADTKSYPLDRLLYQYGQVLAASSPRDAAVRFMQCAILFAGSSSAPPSLFEAARLYAGPLDDAATARRLLERARAAADPDHHAALLEQIDIALAELNSRR
ncbi:MAG: hypothetical protein IT430_18385 [Phycisphaerales bacterium]|nr:hypothetical protein [Phycisphaerales bacterium]